LEAVVHDVFVQELKHLQTQITRSRMDRLRDGCSELAGFLAARFGAAAGFAFTAAGGPGTTGESDNRDQS
jgi:hypothetical protein